MVKSISRKKKAILFILSFLVIIIFLYHFGFFSRYNYLTAKEDIQKGNVRLISDTPFWEAYFLVESLSKEHNVKMEHCEPVFLINNITDKGLNIYNQQMEKQIRINLGEKKYTEYKKALDSLNKRLAKPYPVDIEISDSLYKELAKPKH